jgi:serine/threonine-protein kinase
VTTPAAPGPDGAPRKIGQLLIERKLGEGGTAAVYLGRDQDTREIRVIKIPHDQMVTSEDMKARFIREAKILRQLDHPNIVKLYAFQVFQGVPYIVMEWVDGRTLKEIMARREGRPFEAAQVYRVAKEVASALHHAHDHGVIHFDVKPANVTVTRTGQIKVMDFGISKALEAEGLTRVGTMLGSPQYMSPEQLKGNRTDRRSDIYSLGIVLYQMATGTLPFTGTIMEIMRGHLEHTARPIGELNPAFPRELIAVISRAMTRDPGARYPDFAAMMSDLAVFRQRLQGRPDDVNLRETAVTRDSGVRAAAAQPQPGGLMGALGRLIGRRK